MVFCAVVGCGAQATRDNLKFFRIPSANGNAGRTNDLKARRRECWIRALGRADITEKILKFQRVCSRHFVSGQPSALGDCNNQDWVPTQNMGYIMGDVNETPKFKLNGTINAETHNNPESLSTIEDKPDPKVSITKHPEKPRCNILRARQRPSHSYQSLIRMALSNSPSGVMQFKNIANYISKKFPYYHPLDKKWKGMIRHTLSVYPAFELVEMEEKNGKIVRGWKIKDSNKPAEEVVNNNTTSQAEEPSISQNSESPENVCAEPTVKMPAQINDLKRVSCIEIEDLNDEDPNWKKVRLVYEEEVEVSDDDEDQKLKIEIFRNSDYFDRGIEVLGIDPKRPYQSYNENAENCSFANFLFHKLKNMPKQIRSSLQEDILQVLLKAERNLSSDGQSYN